MKLKSILAGTVASVMLTGTVAFAGPVWDKIQETKVLRAGIMTNSIPGAYYNDKKEWVGFDVDMANEVANRLGCKLEQVPVTDKTRIGFLQQGRIDLSVANMTHKRERDKSIDFSITYFFDGQKILAKKGKYSKWEDLVGKTIATVQGTTSEINIKALMTKLGGAKIVSFQDYPSAFNALKMGRAQAFSTDSTILIGYAAKEPGKYELVGDFLSDEPYGMGLPEDESKLRDAVNFALQDMWKDGKYMEIYNTWYGADGAYYFPMTEKIEMWP